MHQLGYNARFGHAQDQAHNSEFSALHSLWIGMHDTESPLCTEQALLLKCTRQHPSSWYQYVCRCFRTANTDEQPKRALCHCAQRGSGLGGVRNRYSSTAGAQAAAVFYLYQRSTCARQRSHRGAPLPCPVPLTALSLPCPCPVPVLALSLPCA